MFIHAAAFLNENTGIHYHLMIYYDMNREDFSVSIFLLQRTRQPRFYPSKGARNQALNEIAKIPIPVGGGIQTRAGIRRICRSPPFNLPNPSNCSPEEIEEVFGVRKLP